VGIDITINSTTLITLLKVRQNYFDGLFNAVGHVYVYEPLIEQEILKRFDLNILRLFKYLGNRISVQKIDAEIVKKEWNVLNNELREQGLLSLIDTGCILTARETKTVLLTDDYAERLGAERMGVTPVWTTAFMMGLHHKGFLNFDEFLKDAVENKCLWLSKKVVSQLQVLSDEAYINAMLDIESGNNIEDEIAEKLIACGLIKRHSGRITLLCTDILKIIKELKGK